MFDIMIFEIWCTNDLYVVLRCVNIGGKLRFNFGLCIFWLLDGCVGFFFAIDF